MKLLCIFKDYVHWTPRFQSSKMHHIIRENQKEVCRINNPWWPQQRPQHIQKVSAALTVLNFLTIHESSALRVVILLLLLFCPALKNMSNPKWRPSHHRRKTAKASFFSSCPKQTNFPWSRVSYILKIVPISAKCQLN